MESLGHFVDWVPVCPEVESGLDAPRESMRLVQTDGRIRLLTNKTAQDHTTRRHGYARRRVEELVDDALVGFVLKKDSPTWGLERVKVYGTAGMPVKSGRGLFAHAVVARFSLVPVEEGGRLNDPRLRENFVERIFAYRRLRAPLCHALVDGHCRSVPHGSQTHAHGPHAGGLSALGRLAASGKSMTRREFQDRYSSEFMALQAIATPRRQTNVLQHMLGYFKQALDRESRAELLALIQIITDRMQRGYVYWRTEPVGRNFAPGFMPDLTPKEMRRLGIFGGKHMTDWQEEFPRSWFALAELCAEPHVARLNCFR